ncbi:ATP-binding protein [Nonomuraea sp. B19D2]|uniref:ATP-binding protein n=1 Tax=Nonomuraea sp. B19D2 TaxID=3159561 RepID=UPI0032DB2F3D
MNGSTARESEPAAFEATASSPPPPRQRPVGVSPFAGRTDSLAELDRQLDADTGGTRICVVSGTAGVGKTSLALTGHIHSREIHRESPSQRP